CRTAASVLPYRDHYRLHGRLERSVALVAVLLDLSGPRAVQHPHRRLTGGEPVDLDGELLGAAWRLRVAGRGLHAEHLLTDGDVRLDDRGIAHGDHAPVVAHAERSLGQGHLHALAGGHIDRGRALRQERALARCGLRRGRLV